MVRRRIELVELQGARSSGHDPRSPVEAVSVALNRARGRTSRVHCAPGHHKSGRQASRASRYP